MNREALTQPRQSISHRKDAKNAKGYLDKYLQFSLRTLRLCGEYHGFRIVQDRLAVYRLDTKRC